MINKIIFVLLISSWSLLGHCDETDEILSFWEDAQCCCEVVNHQHKGDVVIIVTKEDLVKNQSNVTIGNSAH